MAETNVDTKHAKVIVIRATLDWFTPVWRDIAVSDNQTLITLHRAIQRAFQWDVDHLYAFFMSGREWDCQDSLSYSEPTSLREEGASHPNERSAHVKLRALHLRTGQKIAYVYDYGDNLSVNLVVRKISDAALDIKCPRVIALRGFSPPEENYHEGYTRRINKELKKGQPKIIKLDSKTETEILRQWSDIPEK